MAKAPNYSEEELALASSMYLAGRAEGKSNKTIVAAIAEKLSRAPRSVTSKLSHAKVYLADSAKIAAKDRNEGMTKKESLQELRNMGVFPDAVIDGLLPASKVAIESVLNYMNEEFTDQDEEGEEPAEESVDVATKVA